MGIVANIQTGIETRVANLLGSDYSKLQFVIDTSKNSFKTNSKNKRYGVIPKAGTDTPYKISDLFILQSFEIKLTNGYLKANSNQKNDLVQQATITTLQDLDILLFKDLVENKNLVNSAIVNITDLDIEDVEFIDNNVALSAFTITVKYKA